MRIKNSLQRRTAATVLQPRPRAAGTTTTCRRAQLPFDGRSSPHQRLSVQRIILSACRPQTTMQRAIITSVDDVRARRRCCSCSVSGAMLLAALAACMLACAAAAELPGHGGDVSVAAAAQAAGAEARHNVPLRRALTMGRRLLWTVSDLKLTWEDTGIFKKSGAVGANGASPHACMHRPRY